MIRFSLSSAVFLLVAQAARAQNALSSAHDTAFVKPIASALIAAGSDQIAQFGSHTLNALSRLDSESRFPFVTNPEMLSSLAPALLAQGVSPDSLSSLTSTSEKLQVLAAAAAQAEEDAAPLAAGVDVSHYARMIRMGNYTELLSRVATAQRVIHHLPPDQAEQVAEAAAIVAAFGRKRDALIKTFKTNLPSDLASNVINASTLIRSDEDGWYAADELPGIRYKTLSQLFEARLDRLEKMPDGPWIARQAHLLHGALKQELVENNLAADPAAPNALGAEFYERVSRRLQRAQAGVNEDPALLKTIHRFRLERAKPLDVRRMENLYLAALNDESQDVTARAHIIAAIKMGNFRFPSAEKIDQVKRSLYERYSNNAGIGVLATVIAVLISGKVDTLQSIWTLKNVAIFTSVLIPAVWATVHFLRLDDFSFHRDGVSDSLHLR